MMFRRLAEKRSPNAIIALLICFCGATFGSGGVARGQTGDRPRQVEAIPAGEVTVIVGEQLFNALFDGIFTFAEPPSYALARNTVEGRAGRPSAVCESRISLARESGGVRSGVRLTAERILAPVAFRGTYDGGNLLGCLKFEGWAETSINLSFDASQQTLLGNVSVRAVNVRGVSTLLGGGLTTFVQRAIDERINPIEVIKTQQLSALLPLAKGQSKNALRLRAKEVRPELLRGELRLRIFYEVARADPSAAMPR
ncbi:MAG: hypothetical protein WKF30_11830 [Pyrinomonadaceae bacterium]